MKIKLLSFLTLIFSLVFPLEVLYGLPLAVPNFTPIDANEFILLSFLFATFFTLFVVYKIVSAYRKVKS